MVCGFETVIPLVFVCYVASTWGNDTSTVSNKCDAGLYGMDCDLSCPVQCDTGCTQDSGHCLKCKDPSKWGDLCTLQCLAPQCAMCAIAHGGCLQCKANFTLTPTGRCVNTFQNSVASSKDCKVGLYGQDCDLPCPTQCDGECSHFKGYCLKCKDESTWGDHCTTPCNDTHCANCSIDNGSCCLCYPNFTLSDTKRCVNSSDLNAMNIMEENAKPNPVSPAISGVFNFILAFATVAGVVVVLAQVLPHAIDSFEDGNMPSPINALRDSSIELASDASQLANDSSESLDPASEGQGSAFAILPQEQMPSMLEVPNVGRKMPSVVPGQQNSPETVQILP